MRLLAATCLAAGGIALLARLTRPAPHLPLDLALTRRVQRHRAPWLGRVMRGVSAFGYAPLNWMTLVTASALACWRWGWRVGAFVPLASGASGLSNYWLKRLFGRGRPGEELVEVFLPHGDYSFPSGHVMTYTTLFGFLAYLCRQRLAPGWARAFLVSWNVGLVALIGPSRIYLGAHWLTDVIAAYLAGGAILAYVIALYHIMMGRRQP